MSEEQQLRERAAKKWRWRLLLPGLVGGLGGPLFGNVLFHHRGGHHESALASFGGALVGVAIVVGVVVLVTRRYPRLLAGQGWFSAPLAVGLTRKQRRAAVRAVRRGQVSTDSLLRTVELDLACRSVRQASRSAVFFAVLVPLTLLFAFLGDVTSAGRVYFIVAAVLLAACGLWSLYSASRAKAYLRLSE